MAGCWQRCDSERVSPALKKGVSISVHLEGCAEMSSAGKQLKVLKVLRQDLCLLFRHPG